MNTYGASRTTTAPPERVWSVWSDTANWTRWNSGIRRCDMDGPFESGATAKMETAHGSKHDAVFTEVTPPRRFTLSMPGMPLTRFTFLCEIEPEGSGSVISQRVAFSGPLAFIIGPMMGREMAKHFAPVLDDLAAAAEAPVTSAPLL